MRIVRLGKEYDYDYATIHIKGEIKEELQVLCKEHSLPMGEMIRKMVREYESSSKR